MQEDKFQGFGRSSFQTSQVGQIHSRDLSRLPDQQAERVFGTPRQGPPMQIDFNERTQPDAEVACEKKNEAEGPQLLHILQKANCQEDDSNREREVAEPEAELLRTLIWSAHLRLAVALDLCLTDGFEDSEDGVDGGLIH